MGFYHYLHAVTPSGEKKDVGGYSKGCSTRYWFLAFSPMEYHNNLEQVIKEQNEYISFVGYKTIVGDAMQRLNDYKKRIDGLEDKPMLSKDEKLYREIRNGIYRLLHILEQYQHDTPLILDQTDGSGYSLVYDDEEIIGLHEWWYNNEASQNEALILHLLNSTTTIEEVIKEASLEMEDTEIPNFFDELRWINAENERSYGPQDATVVIDREEDVRSDNPRIVFNNVMKKLLESHEVYKAKQKEVDKNDLDAIFDLDFHSSERDVLEGVNILKSNIGEALDYLRQNSHQ